MTVQELLARFPEIPPGLRQEPFLGELAEAFDEQLRVAIAASSCSGQHYTPENLLYNALVMPMDILGIGLSTQEKTLRELRGHLEEFRADPDAWLAKVVPPSAPLTPGGCAADS